MRPKQTEATLSTLQLNRALLERQFLLERTHLEASEVIAHLVGLQAQIPRTPYLALWTRIQDFEPGNLADLILTRSAVRGVLMRSTIHLVTAEDFLAIWPMTREVSLRQFASTQFARDLNGMHASEVATVASRTLAEAPCTFSALGRALSPHWPNSKPESLAYAARTVLPILQIPPRGLWHKSGQPTWAAADEWLGRAVARKGSMKGLFLRYLKAFGPASVQDFQAWSGLSAVSDAVGRFRSELTVYRDEQGRELFDVRDIPLTDPARPAPVRFLPEYDNVLLAHSDRSRIIPEAFKRRITVGQATVLIDGFVKGTWRVAKNRAATLHVTLFGKLGRGSMAELKREGASLLEFLNGPGAKGAVEISCE